MSSTEQVFGRAWAYGGGAGKSAAEFWRDYSTELTHEQRLTQVRFIARMMDDRFSMPGTKLRFGLDTSARPLAGLGDVVTGAISLLIVHHAWQSGASKLTLARMLGNVGVDFLIGSVPLFGDLVRFRLEGKPQERAPARGASEQEFGQVGGGLASAARRQIQSRLIVPSTVFSSKGWSFGPTKLLTVAV